MDRFKDLDDAICKHIESGSRQRPIYSGWSYFSCRLVRFVPKTRCTTGTYVSSTFGRTVFFVQIGALRGWQPHAARALRFLAICLVRPLRSDRETPYSQRLLAMACSEIGNTTESDERVWRLIDRRLQALKKAGRLICRRPQWALVSPGPKS